MTITLPEAPGSGAVIAIIAPSSPFDSSRLDSGAAVLKEHGFAVDRRIAEDPTPRTYLQGSDERRAALFSAACADPTVGAIYCARGGYGATRLLDYVGWNALAERPVPVLGFSDVTALHLAALRYAGVAGVHAPLATTLAKGDRGSRKATIHLLRTGEAPILRGNPAEGSAPLEGPLLVANLAVLTALVGTPHLPDLTGWILLLEDCNEPAYRLDRMLTQLRSAGVLDQLVAIAGGEFSGTGKEATGDDVLLERTRELGIPYVGGFPVGHGDRNDPAIIGARYRLDPAAATLTPLEQLSAAQEAAADPSASFH